jgi:hypothetical protein
LFRETGGLVCGIPKEKPVTGLQPAKDYHILSNYVLSKYRQRIVYN